MKRIGLIVRSLLRRPSTTFVVIGLLWTSIATVSNAQSTYDDLMRGDQHQPLPSSSFGREPGRNGLQSPGSLSFSVEAIFGDVQDSNALIGSPDAPQVFNNRFYAASLDVFDGAHVGISELEPSLVGQQLSSDASIGTRARANYRGDMNSGLEFSGFWLGDADRSWQRGLGGFDAGADPTNVRVTAALPLNDGAGGYAVPYDQYFRFGLATNMYGLGADYAPTGGYWGAVLFQPTIGARYFDMGEKFDFRAADSGLSYVHEANGLPDPATLFPPNPAFPPYQSVLDATADNRLLGPCLGINVSTTAKLVRFVSNSRVGVLFVESEQSLSGRGFGNGFAPGFDPTIAFADSQSQSYATAFLEQSLNMDIELLRILPKFAEYQGENSLALRLGWSVLVIDSVTRPVESVAWNGFPLTPTLTNDRAEFLLHTLNVGVVFQY